MVIDLPQMTRSDAIQMLDWVVNTYGPTGERWHIKDLRYLVFNREKDATMFLLYWSGR